MKSNIYFLFLALFIISCKQQGNSSSTTIPDISTGRENSTSDEIISYVNDFEETYNETVTLPVYFDTSSSTGGSSGSNIVIGVCKIYSNGYREVIINRPWWNASSATSKRILIFHELGHCVFNRNHDYALDSNNNRICDGGYSNGTCLGYRYRTESNGMPTSIMYPVINNIYNFYSINNDNRMYYDYELKNAMPSDVTQKTAWQTAFTNYKNSLMTNNQLIAESTMKSNEVPQDIPYDGNSEPKYQETCVQYIE